MSVRAAVRRSYYQDSMVLMRLAAELRALPGVREVAALMGTPANHGLLGAAGLATADTRGATPADLIISVEADADPAAASALARAAVLLDERTRAREAAGPARPRTLETALRA